MTAPIEVIYPEDGAVPIPSPAAILASSDQPEPTMLRGALGRLGVAAEDAVLVGDRLTTYIRMANEPGVRSFLVLTGGTRREDLPQAADRPTEVCDSLREVHRRLLPDG